MEEKSFNDLLQISNSFSNSNNVKFFFSSYVRIRSSNKNHELKLINAINIKKIMTTKISSHIVENKVYLVDLIGFVDYVVNPHLNVATHHPTLYKV